MNGVGWLRTEMNETGTETATCCVATRAETEDRVAPCGVTDASQHKGWEI